jgi:hypothetical protein
LFFGRFWVHVSISKEISDCYSNLHRIYAI